MGHGDAQTHYLAKIEFLHDFHTFYISYIKMKNYGVQK